MLFERTKKPKTNYFEQVASLSYEPIGTLRCNGSEYEVFKKEAKVNFGGNGEELSTVAFKLRRIGEKKEYFTFVSNYEDNGDSKIKLRSDEDTPLDIIIAFFDEFVIPHSKMFRKK